MSKVAVTKSLLDNLAASVSHKSGEELPLTIEEMTDAVDGIEVVNNQTRTVNPGTISFTVTPMAGYTGLSEVTVNAMPSGTAGTPTATKGTVSNHSVSVTPSVTNTTGYITGSTINGTAVSVSASELVSGDLAITQSGVADVTNYATATVPSGTEGAPTATKGTVSNHAISVTPSVTNSAGYINGGTHNGTAVSVSASELVSGTLIINSSGTADVTNLASVTVEAGSATASATKGTVSNHSVTVTPSVTRTAGYVTAGSSNGTAVSVSASELVSGTLTPSAIGSYDVTDYASVRIDGGSVGQPTATKGAVTNHSVSVTPSVTSVQGWISSGTKQGTSVTVSASELVSGNLPITQNGNNIDVTNYATVSVNVSGGGGNPVAIGAGYNDSGGDRTSISFGDLLGEPTSFVVFANNAIALPSGTPYKTSAVVYDGTSHHAQILTNTSNAQASYDSSSFSHTYSNGTLTISSSGAHFVDADWVLQYSYGGTSANVHTADVQVGSGATSITFTGLEDEPLGWSLIFKSNFGTSSGYQRVISVAWEDTANVHEGLCLDSQARYSSSYWSSSYNNGSLTITSQGTNAGGYFHQPGYYQLTYVLADASPYQKVSKTYYATTTAQTEKVSPSTGYDALAEVNVTVGALSQTNLTAGNIKSGTTVTINNGNTNVWSVTGTYTGGGGSFSVATTTWNNSTNTTTSHEFTGLSGTPKFAVLRCTSQLTRSSSNTYYYIADIVWNGTNAYGNYHLRSNGSFNNVASNATTKFTVTTGTNSITFTSGGTRGGAPGSFYNGTYELTYVY